MLPLTRRRGRALFVLVGLLASCSSSNSSTTPPKPSMGAGMDGGSGGSGSGGGSSSSGPGTDGGPTGGESGTGDTDGSVTLPGGGGYTATAPVDFGPNVLIFDPSMGDSAIQSKITTVFNGQQTNQFGSARYAYFFKPGKYNLDVQLGFYMEVLGLGASPDDVSITGAVRSMAKWDQGNATQNFWRLAENLSVTPSSSINTSDTWAVSAGDRPPSHSRQRRDDPLRSRGRPERLVERRVHRRLEDRRHRRLRQPAAVSHAQRHDAELVGGRLEHGLRRQRGQPDGDVAEVALHVRRHDTGRSREAVPDHRRVGELRGRRSDAHPEHAGDDLGVGRRTLDDDPDHGVLHRPFRRRTRRTPSTRRCRRART